MTLASGSSGKTNALRADYTGPNSSKTFSEQLPSASVSTTIAKTQYLSALRNSVVKIQDDINGYLTKKMDEDKILAASAGKKVDDKVAEENYGEEVVDEDV